MSATLRLFLVLTKWASGIEGSRSKFIGAMTAGLIAGFGNIAMIAVINNILTRGFSKPALWYFAGLCVLVPLSGFISQALLIRLTAQATRNLRIKLSHQIIAAPYRMLEELGVHRLLSTITDDTSAISDGIASLRQLGTQVAMISGCLIYLGWLSRPLLLMALGYLAVAILVYQWPVIKSVHYFRLMRNGWNACFKGFRALTEGTKELKLHRHRRQDFMSQELEPAIDEVYRYEVLAGTISTAASNGGQGLFFLPIGLLLFLGAVSLGVDRQALTGYTLTILFMFAPLSAVLAKFPILGRACAAAESVEAFSAALAKRSFAEDASARIRSWNELRISGLVHKYDNNESHDVFRLGPIDLRFKPEEIVFITGGNGSGKTTLLKLLVGLYEPDEGTITVDQNVITSANRDSYRQLFSVIFYDFYLFDQLYGLRNTKTQAVTQDYLRRLRLNHKVSIEDGKLSTVDLSQGQRKRLALLTAYLEDRPIYVFDEWAADQDPAFKEVFYHEILSDLKARGKTVIVISHDDRYYGIADRIIKLENGQVQYEHRVGAAAFVQDDSVTVARLSQS